VEPVWNAAAATNGKCRPAKLAREARDGDTARQVVAVAPVRRLGRVAREIAMFEWAARKFWPRALAAGRPFWRIVDLPLFAAGCHRCVPGRVPASVVVLARSERARTATTRRHVTQSRRYLLPTSPEHAPEWTAGARGCAAAGGTTLRRVFGTSRFRRDCVQCASQSFTKRLTELGGHAVLIDHETRRGFVHVPMHIPPHHVGIKEFFVCRGHRTSPAVVGRFHRALVGHQADEYTVDAQ
jgi:hypothetical protein